MALIQDWLAEAGWSLLRMLANPFYYVGIVFVVLLRGVLSFVC